MHFAQRGCPEKILNFLGRPSQVGKRREILGQMFDLRDHLAHGWSGVETAAQRHRDTAPGAHSQGELTLTRDTIMTRDTIITRVLRS